jgi:hypothetical protein
MKTLLTAAVVLFFAGAASAADYVLYKDASGRIVLSNLPPPPSTEIVARQNLADATAEEIAATEKANLEIAKIDVLRDLANSYERCVEANQRAYVPRPVAFEWNQVAVSTGFLRRRR